MPLLPVWLSLVIACTDGKGCVTNAQDRWPDFMSAVLNGEHESKSSKTGVLNLGIRDNRILSVGLGQWERSVSIVISWDKEDFVQ